MQISVVVPVYNERENIVRLYDRLQPVLAELGRSHEILFIDDGSRDGTLEELARLAKRDSAVKVVELRRNFGQTAALQAGLQLAAGEAIVTMDGDLQNDPADIPLMLAELESGYDLVHGWRVNRQDTFINRKLPSKIANWVISRTTGFPIHDLGCTLKVMRREIARELELYGEMHRFIPILAHQRGARCSEVGVRHHARQFGQTKYGISRTLRVVLDLVTVKYMLDYFASPMKLFGRFGLACLAASCGALAAVVGMKLAGGVDMTGNPLLLFSGFSLLAGVQFFSLGLLGEVNARIYFRNDRKENYAVRQLTNFESTGTIPSPAARRAA